MQNIEGIDFIVAETAAPGSLCGADSLMVCAKPPLDDAGLTALSFTIARGICTVYFKECLSGF